MAESSSKFDPSIQTEDIAFRDDELIACPKCGRKNPPNRAACMYCAAGLGIEPVAGVGLKLRKPEPWENGYNVALFGSQGDVKGIARTIPISSADLERLAASGAAFPVSRVGRIEDAETVIRSFPENSFETAVVSDKDLDAARPPKRLAGLEFGTDTIGFIDFNTRESRQVPVSEIAAVVTGTIVSGKTDTVEKRKRGKETKILDEAAVVSDESVIDIYTKDDRVGYRVHTAGFDFSCLGDDKSMLATENLRLLAAALRDAAPMAGFVATYDQIAPLLSEVWPTEVRKDHRGLVRTGIGKREFGMSELTSNAEQFTKFSRLQWYAK